MLTKNVYESNFKHFVAVFANEFRQIVFHSNDENCRQDCRKNDDNLVLYSAGQKYTIY